MSIDLEFNYEDSLIRQQLYHEKIEKLRQNVEHFEFVPTSMTNKQVSQCF